jgi:uncharacterized protein DUF5916
MWQKLWLIRCPQAMLGVVLLGFAPLRGQTPDTVLTIPRVERAPEIEEFLVRGGHPHGSGTWSGPSTGNGTTGTTGTATAHGSGPEAGVGAGVRVTDFRQREPGDGVPVSRGTTAYVSYDDANLYVVFVCEDDPAQVRARIARREEISGDDQVAVYLDTFRDGEHAYFFVANPLGVQLDGIWTEGQDEDFSFDTVWHSEGRLTASGYVVRMTIPFRSLRFPRASTQTWGIALGRIIQRNNEEAYWPHLTKRVKGFVPQFRALQGLTDISSGRNVQVNPYSVFARARVLDQDAPAFNTAGDERLGVDAKLVVRDALTLDATVNPDFSQVETDDPQVTVNERFDLFFPEKRPFFLENSGYFTTPVNLFHSRRVVDPGAGLRLTGKAGRWAVGAIAINDRAPGRVATPDPLAGSRAAVGAARVQRELGEESTVGFLVTDRELERNFNRMFSVDSRLKLGSNWAFAGQLMQSETRELDATTRLSGSGGFAELTREGRNFDYSGRYLQFSPDFTAPLGFVQRVGIRQTEHEWKIRWRPNGKTVTNYGPQLSTLFVWDPDGRQLDREIKAEFQMELVRQSEVKFERTEAFELFEDRGFRPYSNKASFATEWFKWLTLDASYQWGAAVNHDPAGPEDLFLGRAAEAEVNVTLRPTPRLRLDQAAIHSRLNTRSGERVFTERLWRTKVNYQFNRFLSLRAIVDYESQVGDTTLAELEDERKWGADLLLTYLVNPGTALHVGYTDHFENLGLVGSPPSLERRRRPDTSTGRQLFVKLSYLLRF